MKRLNSILLCLIVFTGLLFSNISRADEYVAPTYGNLIKMLVRFGAIDLSDNDALNSYALIHECKLFNYFYHDEFKWHEFQKALRRSVQQEVEAFPTAIRYTSKLQLGRYDFKEKIYRFTPKTSPRNVNLFTLNAAMDCDDGKTNIFPTAFNLVLDQPLNIAGLPLSEEEGKVLLKRMEEGGNKDRILYANFNMRVIYIAPLARVNSNMPGKPKGNFVQSKTSNVTRIDAHLASIDFFEDPENTKLIYSYRP